MSRFGFAKATAVAALSFFAVTGTAATAGAQNIMNVNGNVNVRDPIPGGGPSDNLFIDFLTNNVAGFGTAGTATVVEDTDLPGVALGSIGSIQDLEFNESGSEPTTIPNFFTIGSYTFTLTGTATGNAFGPISLLPVGNNTIAAFSGFGTVTGGIFGSSVRNFDLSVSSQFNNVTPDQLFAIIDGGGTRNASFSATFTIAGPTQVVPEPSTYALLATGLGALGMVARRRRNQA